MEYMSPIESDLPIIKYVPQKMWWGKILFKKIQAALLTFRQTHDSTRRMEGGGWQRPHANTHSRITLTQGLGAGRGGAWRDGTMLLSAECQGSRGNSTNGQLGVLVTTLSMSCDPPSLNRSPLLHLGMLEVVISITCPMAL